MVHPLDTAIVAAYLAVVLWLGKRASAGARTEEGFFLANRRFGKLLQFFFNFGNTTEAYTAVSTVSFVYRDGASGAWLPLQMIFLNPYYWFMNTWFRRVRLVTMAELFEARLGSRGLAVVYALFQIGVSMMLIGFGNFISYKILAVMAPGLSPLAFYAGYAAVSALYLAMGGMLATAFNQVFQGVLVLAFSVMLIPFGWRALHGVPLRDRLAPGMFTLFAGARGGEFTIWAVLALLAVSIVQINANVVNMGLGGSARDEFAARFGAVSGTFGKRIMIVLWAFLGLIAAALYGGPRGLADPDTAWGVLSLRFLGPGLLGVMLSGVLASNMPSTASKTIAMSALFVRNLYRPFAPRVDAARAVLAGRIAVAVVLTGSVAAALAMREAIAVTKLLLIVNLPFGASVLLMFFWRRLTRAAVWWCVIATSVAVFAIPYGVQAVPALRVGPGTGGTAAYFETVSRRNPADPATPLEGRGRFNFEAWLLDRAGLRLASAGPGVLLAAQFFFDAAFPFVVLIGVSLMTRPPPAEAVDRFFGVMRTPVGATPELDAAAVEETRRNPRRFDGLKLFPGSAWEMTRWDRTDAVGFGICCAVSAAILGAFWLALSRLG